MTFSRIPHFPTLTLYLHQLITLAYRGNWGNAHCTLMQWIGIHKMFVCVNPTQEDYPILDDPLKLKDYFETNFSTLWLFNCFLPFFKKLNSFKPKNLKTLKLSFKVFWPEEPSLVFSLQTPTLLYIPHPRSPGPQGPSLLSPQLGDVRHPLYYIFHTLGLPAPRDPLLRYRGVLVDVLK